VSTPDEHAKLAHDAVVRQRMRERAMRRARLRPPTFFGLVVAPEPDGFPHARLALTGP
jgi:hypothetical protein